MISPSCCSEAVPRACDARKSAFIAFIRDQGSGAHLIVRLPVQWGAVRAHVQLALAALQSADVSHGVQHGEQGAFLRGGCVDGGAQRDGGGLTIGPAGERGTDVAGIIALVRGAY